VRVLCGVNQVPLQEEGPDVSEMDSGVSNRVASSYERFTVFEYALVLLEERYLIEVQTRKPDSGDLRWQEEIEGIAKECLVLAIGEGHDDEVRDVKPNPISESDLQSLNLKKVQQLLNRPDCTVYLVE
jgi:hypothetical protein